jgi:hypothetical protein
MSSIVCVALDSHFVFGCNIFFFGFEVDEGIDLVFLVIEPILKCHFLTIDDKEMENVNKGGQKVSKHGELWANYVVIEWKIFYGFNTN